MPDKIKTTADNPVGYLITCQVAEWHGKSAVVINQGGDPQVGYSIWSMEDMRRVISELATAAEKAWPPTIIRYVIDPNNPPPLTDEQKAEIRRLPLMAELEELRVAASSLLSAYRAKYAGIAEGSVISDAPLLREIKDLAAALN